MFCENCGANIPDTSKFCTECGTTVDGAVPEAKPAAPVQPVLAATLVTPPQQQPSYTPQPQRPLQPAYAPPQQPYYNNQAVSYGFNQANHEPLGVGSYIGMFFLSAIPLVGFICLLVWAFGSNANLNKKNYARAILIMGLIAVVLWVVIFVIGLAVGGSILNGLY